MKYFSRKSVGGSSENLRGDPAEKDKRGFTIVLLCMAGAELLALGAIGSVFGWRFALILNLIVNGGLGIGVMIGFLFGMPRFIGRREDAGPPEGAAARAPSPQRTMTLQHNTPLEDISDWLSKIIVGVGLVELNAIKEMFVHLCGKAGHALALATDVPNLPTSMPWISAADLDNEYAIAVGGALIFHFVVGVFAAFSFCRLFLTSAISRVNVEVDKILRADIEAVSVIPSAEIDTGGKELTLEQRGIVEEVAGLNIDDLKSSKDVLVWAKANALIGNYDRAVQGYRRVTASSPNDPRVRRQYGKVLRKMGAYRDAVGELEKARELADPGDRDLVDKISIDLAIAYLYLPVDGPYRALGLFRHVPSDQEVAMRWPDVLTIRASAYGQIHRRLSEVPSGTDALDQATVDARRKAYEGALSAVRAARANLPTTASAFANIRNMMNPRGSEPDLASFIGDKRFVEELAPIPDEWKATPGTVP